MGCKILKLVTWPWTRPFQGRFVIDMLGHAMINLLTKFEVPNFTRYSNMKGVAVCRKWGVLVSPQVNENSDIQYGIYEFLLAFHSKYVSILHLFWDTANDWSIITDLNLPHLYLAPPLGISLECHWDFWHQKTRVPGRSYGLICVRGLAIFVQL